MSKLLTVLVLVLFVVPSLTYRFNAHKVQLDKIKAQKGTWGSFLVNLAEVHLATGGPLNELMEAIEDVVQDLNHKLDRAHEDFDRRTVRHEEEVRRINDLIDSASADIAATTEFLQLLGVQKQALLGDIASTEKAIEKNREVTEQSIELRAQEHAEYVAKIPEHNEAIAALDEALEVLSQLDGVDGGASFIQIKKLGKSVETLNKKLKRGQDKAFLNALMEMANNNKFADKSALLRVANLMKEVRNNLTASLAQLEDEEQAAQAAHEEHLEMLAAKLNSLEMSLTELREFLAETEDRIVDNQEFLQQRINDKAQSEQDLQDENDSYQHDTEVFEDLVAQFNTELSACGAALDHLQNSDIADYIGDRMSMDKVIDTNHGMENLNVEVNPHDME